MSTGGQQLTLYYHKSVVIIFNHNHSLTSAAGCHLDTQTLKYHPSSQPFFVRILVEMSITSIQLFFFTSRQFPWYCVHEYIMLFFKKYNMVMVIIWVSCGFLEKRTHRSFYICQFWAHSFWILAKTLTTTLLHSTCFSTRLGLKVDISFCVDHAVWCTQYK